MSWSLLKPNNYSIYSNELITNNIATDEITATNSVNAPSGTFNDLTVNNNLTIENLIVNNNVSCSTLTLSNQKIVPFQFYFYDAFAQLNAIPGTHNITILKISDFIIVDFPDVTLNVASLTDELIIADPGLTSNLVLTTNENVSKNYIFNYIMNISSRTQCVFNIPNGLNSIWIITKFDLTQFQNSVITLSNTFICKVV